MLEEKRGVLIPAQKNDVANCNSCLMMLKQINANLMTATEEKTLRFKKLFRFFFLRGKRR